MKGMVMSIIALLVSISIISLSYIVATQKLDIIEVVSRDILAKRIYYKFQTVSDSVVKIIGVEGNLIVTMNVTIDEQTDYSYVNFTEKLPQDVDNFNEDLARYERFAETYLPEKNIEVEVNVAGIGGKMTLVVEPYNITYDHEEFGKRQVTVIPEDNDSSLGNLNSYTINVQLLNGWGAMSETAEWAPKKNGDLKVSITIDGYETTEFLDRYRKSAFMINTNATIGETYYEGWIRARISEDISGSLVFEMHLCEAMVTTGLNLTEMEGKTRVNMPDGKINITETLYEIEKSSTVIK